MSDDRRFSDVIDMVLVDQVRDVVARIFASTQGLTEILAWIIEHADSVIVATIRALPDDQRQSALTLLRDAIRTLDRVHRGVRQELAEAHHQLVDDE